MDSTYVLRRTPKGEQEVSLRSLPYAAWLALVMIDGRSSVGDLASLQPELPELELSLRSLLKEGYIEVASPRAAGGNVLAAGVDAESTSSQESVSRPFDGSRRWSKRVLVLLPFLIVVASLLLVQRSLEHFTVHVEELLAMQPGKVSIGSSAIVFRPRPALRLANVTAGRSLRAGELLARPSWLTLLGGRGPISLIELRDAKVSASDLLALLHPAAAPQNKRDVWAERVTFAASKLDLGGTAIPFSGELTYQGDGELKHAHLTIDSGKAQVSIAGSAVELSARGWSPPTAPVVSFEQVDASGTLESTRLVLDRIEALVHDGLVNGSVVMDWSVGLLAEGRFTTSNLDVASLVGSFARDFAVAGRLDATGEFATRAADADALLEQLRLNADFRVKRGVLYSADISAAAIGDTRGGTTQFEDLSGNVQTAARSLSFRDVKLTSGTFSAKGNLDITSSRQVVGRFTVRLKSKGDKATTISVGGSVSEPKFRLDD